MGLVTGQASSLLTVARATGRTVCNSGGLYVWNPANNVMGFDYDPVTKAPLGVLIEEQRTNLVLNSVFAGGGPAPTSFSQPFATGSSSAAVSTSASGVDAYEQVAAAQRPLLATTATLSFAANTTYALSMMIEAVSGGLTAQDLLRLAALPAGATASWPVCAANAAGIAAGAVQPGRLLMLVAVAATAGASQVYFGIGCLGNATGSVRFSLPQVEAGSFATSFIPTSGSQVTRAADNISLLTSAFPFSDTSGVLVAQYDIFGVQPGSAASGVLQLDPNALQRGHALQVKPPSPISGIRSRGATNVSADIGGTVTLNALIKVAGAYQGSANRRSSTNGGAVVGDTTDVGVIAAMTHLRFGFFQITTPAAFLNGHIRRMKYLPRFPSDAELQAFAA